VWNAGTCRPDAKGETQIGGPYEGEIYAETRAALAPPSRPRGDPNLARLQTLDHEIAEAAKTLPGIKDGQSAFEDLVESGKEAVQKLFSTVQQTFSRDADLRGPSPSPGFGR
jgi:hypothetical protein